MRLLGLVALFWSLTASAQTYILPSSIAVTYSNGGISPPSVVVPVGFTNLTFTSTTFSATNVDIVDDCFANGFPTRGGHCSKQWYSYHNSGSTPVGNNGNTTTPGSCLANITFSSGVMVLLGCKSGPNGQVTTATPNSNGTDWAGTAFGCGAYFEWTAVMSDAITGGNNTNSTTGSGGWQALWSQPIEFSYIWDSATRTALWAGQGSTYVHSLEDDAFELTATGSQPYGSALHELYGISGSTCTGPCQLSSSISRGVSAGYVSTNSYRYGALWVPATASTRGYVKYFRNEVQQSSITQTWDQFVAQTPAALPQGGTFSATCTANNGSPSSTNCVGARTGAGQGLGNPTWIYGVHDLYHYAPIMGTGTGSIINGGSNPVPTLNISQFNVWQGSGACNISN